MFDADEAAGAVLALRQQVAVHLVDDVADRLLADLEVVRVRAVARRVHHRRHVDSAALAREPPEQARHERQHRLPRHATPLTGSLGHGSEFKVTGGTTIGCRR